MALGRRAPSPARTGGGLVAVSLVVGVICSGEALVELLEGVGHDVRGGDVSGDGLDGLVPERVPAEGSGGPRSLQLEVARLRLGDEVGRTLDRRVVQVEILLPVLVADLHVLSGGQEAGDARGDRK